MGTTYTGYMGKVLMVNLTTETFSEYPWTDEQRKRFLGGAIMSGQILAEHLTGTESAFSEENWFILSTGPLTGIGAPGSFRCEISALSPKTGLPASSNCGGSLGTYLKKAGYDALILSGRCKTHRWLEVCEDQIHFHDATDLWGLGTAACSRRLDQLIRDPFGYLCIGPAGEDLFPCATIISDGKAAGRAGLGAVLGWKRLKAISISGSKTIPLHNRDTALATLHKWNQIITEQPLTSAPDKISSCPGCPIRCKNSRQPPDSTLDDLGLDSMESAKYSHWLSETSGSIPASPRKSKHGRRKDQLYHAILDSFALPDGEHTRQFYQNFTESLSAMGLCIFTVSTCFPGTPKRQAPVHTIAITDLLRQCTGLDLTPEQLLSIGAHHRTAQEMLCSRFKKIYSD